MRILVFEPDHGGHRYNWVGHMLDGLGELEVDTVLMLGVDAPNQPEYQTHLAERTGGERVTVDPSIPGLPERRSATGTARSRSKILLDAIGHHRADHVLVPYADGLSQALGARRALRLRLDPQLGIEGCVHKAAFAYPPAGTLQGVRNRVSLGATRLAPWTALHRHDPKALRYLPLSKPAARHVMPGD